MASSRREFLRLSALVSTSLVLPFVACGPSASKEKKQTVKQNENTAASGIASFGIQLWTVKEAMHENPQETLRQLASFGYKQIESFEGEKGMFWGMKPAEFKTFVEDLGMTLLASHCNVKENFEAKVEQAAEIGMEYLIDPYEGPQESLDDYRRMAERFNSLGELCKQHNLRFAYHNHDYTFKEVAGEMPQDILLKQTNPELVDFELDIYWVVTAGADPEKYFREYPNRFRLCHVKDRLTEVAAAETNASTVLGKGTIDYPRILATARENGMQHYLVEQERFEGMTPLESSKLNAAYMQEFRFRQ
jgi:sugar phosphate isomerase/epimerase